MPTAPTSEPIWASAVACAVTESHVRFMVGGSTAMAELVEVPGLDRTPRAAARAWPVCERNGRIFVWHHAGSAPPSYEVIGYRPNEANWTPWRCNTYRVRVHVQDLTENIIDRSHFSAVHDMARPEKDHFEVRFEGPSMVVEQSLKVTAVDVTGYEIQTTTHDLWTRDRRSRGEPGPDRDAHLHHTDADR